MSIHGVLCQQNDFDSRDSWCESPLTIRGTELEKEQNAGGEGGCWRLFSGLVSHHCGFKWLKPATNKFTCSAFTIFSIKVSSKSRDFRFQSQHVLNIKKLSNRCRSVNFT